MRVTPVSINTRIGASIKNRGDGNPSKRPEVRAKMSRAQTGKKQSLKTRMKRSRSLKGNPKIRTSHLGNTSRKGTSTSIIGHYNMSLGAVRRLVREHSKHSYTKTKFDKGFVHLSRLGVDLFHRSSYEKIGLFFLDTKVEVKKIEVESVKIPYVGIDKRVHIYIPDWLVYLISGQRILIEVKPNYLVEEKWNLLKFEAAYLWAEKNNSIFCIWTEDVLCNNGSTTMSLQAIVEATVAGPQGRRYSLNSMETLRGEQKCLTRLTNCG